MSTHPLIFTTRSARSENVFAGHAYAESGTGTCADLARHQRGKPNGQHRPPTTDHSSPYPSLVLPETNPLKITPPLRRRTSFAVVRHRRCRFPAVSNLMSVCPGSCLISPDPVRSGTGTGWRRCLKSNGKGKPRDGEDRRTSRRLDQIQRNTRVALYHCYAALQGEAMPSYPPSDARSDLKQNAHSLSRTGHAQRVAGSKSSKPTTLASCSE